MCKPLCEGRLRIRGLSVQIKAFQAKQLWRVLNERTSSYMGPTGECIIWCRTGGYPDVDVHKCFLCRKSIASTNFFVHQHKKWRIRDLHRLIPTVGRWVGGASQPRHRGCRVGDYLLGGDGQLQLQSLRG